MPATLKTRATEYLKGLQYRICASLEALDGKATFRRYTWERPGGGGGRTRVIGEGNVFEKGGVNFSEVYGEMAPEFAKQLPGEGNRFFAAGVSLVLHPKNPHIPTVHANFRLIQKGEASWFGGGADLTPYYPHLEDVVHFHRTWKAACDRHPEVANYERFKEECDKYFYLPHRGEARGVGGIFFDYQQNNPEKVFEFVQDAGDQFVSSYGPIVQRRKGMPYTEAQRDFQTYRRGRYVEFNLIFDRGTIFGLKTNGRTESILMSLPPIVRFVYDYQAAPGTEESKLTSYWLQPRDWAAEKLTGE
jgi:coproporphyrinogen III oxidase